MEQMKIFFIFVLLLAGVGYSKEMVSKPLYVNGSQFEGVIFQCGDPSMPSDKPCWTPNVYQVRQMENHLGAFLLAQHNRIKNSNPLWKAWDSSKNFSEYKRQYWGLYEKGRKVIYVSLFCLAEKDWKEKVHRAHGGGTCFLEIKYDPGTGEYFDYGENPPK